MKNDNYINIFRINLLVSINSRKFYRPNDTGHLSNFAGTCKVCGQPLHGRDSIQLLLSSPLAGFDLGPLPWTIEWTMKQPLWTHTFFRSTSGMKKICFKFHLFISLADAITKPDTIAAVLYISSVGLCPYRMDVWDERTSFIA